MQIRLHGTPTRNAAILAAPTDVLHIHSISRPYPDRPPSHLERIYLHAEALDPKEARP